MPENENNDDVMNDDSTNLPEDGTDMEGGEIGSDGIEGSIGEDGMEGGEGKEEETGDDESGMEDGNEEGTGDDDMMFGDDDMMFGGDDMFFGVDGMDGDMGTETGVKDPILSSVPFVSITIGAALVVGIVLGILLGKKRIKKGFDLYEN